MRIDIEADRDAFELRNRMSAAGERLVSVLDELNRDRGVVSSSPTAPLSETAWDDFAAELVNRIAEPTGLVTDAVVRRAARRSVDRLLRSDDPKRPDGASHGGGPGSITGELLCEVYRWFFADVVAEFVQAAIAEQVKLVVPVLAAVDPAGSIADWIAEQIYELIPSPCEQVAAAVRSDGPEATLTDIARDLVTESVERALGCGGEPEVAA